MEIWLIWFVVAVALGVAEVFVTAAVFGVLGGAALVPVVLAAVGVPLPFQVLAFAVASVLGVVLVRPVALRHMYQPQLEQFGVEALVGKKAYVVREVTDRDGLVRIDGEEWTARTFGDVAEFEVIPVGAAVDVMRISGTTAFVYPRE